MELRQVVHDYLEAGKLLQVATISQGTPRLSNVWFAHNADLTEIVFTSNKVRKHSEDIRSNSAVAGSVVSIPLEGLGQKVRGLTFQGRAIETQGDELTRSYDLYAARWPRVRTMFTAEAVASDSTPMRMYLIQVREYVLWDEVNYPDAPRQVLAL